jgi:hypothetical protein
MITGQPFWHFRILSRSTVHIFLLLPIKVTSIFNLDNLE